MDPSMIRWLQHELSMLEWESIVQGMRIYVELGAIAIGLGFFVLFAHTWRELERNSQRIKSCRRKQRNASTKPSHTNHASGLFHHPGVDESVKWADLY